MAGDSDEVEADPATDVRAASGTDEEVPAGLADLLGARCPFGPGFFLSQLRALARDRCPDPAEHVPVVELHLSDGTALSVCHVIGLAPAWIAVAVYEDPERESASMRTELVAYATIVRVTIRAGRHDDHRMGFRQDGSPPLLTETTPEDALRALATTHRHVETDP